MSCVAYREFFQMRAGVAGRVTVTRTGQKRLYAGLTGVRSSSEMQKNAIISPSYLLLLLAMGLGNSGCRSPSPEVPDSFAAVIIRGHSRMEIDQVATQVFAKHDYARVKDFPGPDFTFEKKGTKMNTLVYGGWYGEVWLRVKVYLDSNGLDVYLLRCDAFMVGDHNDPLVEEEHEQGRSKRGRYQKILDEIKATLEVTPAVRSGS
jgi:hypothetical protein